jgi:hypothetical protein
MEKEAQEALGTPDLTRAGASELIDKLREKNGLSDADFPW